MQLPGPVKSAAPDSGRVRQDCRGRRAPLAGRLAGAAAALVLLALAPWSALHAQLPSPLDPTGRERPPLPGEEPRPTPPPAPILPPIPPPTGPGAPPLPVERVFVRAIDVVGSTVFSAEELARVTAPYTNRAVSAEDLEALRLALTRLYVDRGYVNSGAILPDQTVSEGVVTYQIVEGRLTEIEIEGQRWFRAGYLRRRLVLGAGPPVNTNELQRRLQLLLEDQRIRRLNAELRPGLGLGEGVLSVKVEERVPYRLVLDVNNHQSVSVGAERGIVGLEHQNLTGNGDVLTLRYGRSEGLDPLLDFRYAVPLTARDTTFSVQYRKNTFQVVEEPFEQLEIESDSEIFTLALRQPVYRTLNTEVAVELLGERLWNQTLLLGERFSLLPGARDGKTVVTALRTALEWVHRTQQQVVAARSRFSVGIDALGATVNGGDQPDGQFFAWLGQFQWVRRLPILDAQAIFRTDVQLADDPLLTLEQVAVGGRFSVRGYRENTLVRDNALLASLEARLPLVRNVAWADFLEVAPFVDYGRAWSTRGETPKPRDLASVGVGLRWAVTLPGPIPIRPYLEVYWGHRLRTVEKSDGNLQDKGIHLQFVVAVF